MARAARTALPAAALDDGVSLARPPNVVASARGSTKADEAERKRSMTAARAALFAVGALVVMRTLRRYRKSRHRRARDR